MNAYPKGAERAIRLAAIKERKRSTALAIINAVKFIRTRIGGVLEWDDPDLSDSIEQWFVPRDSEANPVEVARHLGLDGDDHLDQAA